MMSLFFGGQNISANQISSTYLNPWLRYNYFLLRKTNVAILKFLFSLWLWPDRSNFRAILNTVPKFRPNRAIRGGVLASYTISSWLPWRLHTTSGFVFDYVTLFRRSTYIRQPKCHRDILIHSWDITTSGLEKQPFAILEFYFRFQLWPYHRHVNEVDACCYQPIRRSKFVDSTRHSTSHINARYWSKIAIFHTPPAFDTSEGLRRNIAV